MPYFCSGAVAGVAAGAELCGAELCEAGGVNPSNTDFLVLEGSRVRVSEVTMKIPARV